MRHPRRRQPWDNKLFNHPRHPHHTADPVYMPLLCKIGQHRLTIGTTIFLFQGAVFLYVVCSPVYMKLHLPGSFLRFLQCSGSVSRRLKCTPLQQTKWTFSSVEVRHCTAFTHCTFTLPLYSSKDHRWTVLVHLHLLALPSLSGFLLAISARQVQNHLRGAATKCAFVFHSFLRFVHHQHIWSMHNSALISLHPTARKSLPLMNSFCCTRMA